MLLLLLLGGRGGGGRRRGGGRGALGGRGGGGRRRGGGGLLRRGRAVVGLVALDGTHRLDDADGAVTVPGSLEHQVEAVVNDALGSGGIGLHVGGLKDEVGLAAHVFDGCDHHKGPQAFHAAALFEVYP